MGRGRRSESDGKKTRSQSGSQGSRLETAARAGSDDRGDCGDRSPDAGTLL